MKFLSILMDYVDRQLQGQLHRVHHAHQCRVVDNVASEKPTHLGESAFSFTKRPITGSRRILPCKALIIPINIKANGIKCRA